MNLILPRRPLNHRRRQSRRVPILQLRRGVEYEAYSVGSHPVTRDWSGGGSSLEDAFDLGSKGRRQL